MTRIFISYRRDDSAGHAGRVHDRLEREFKRELLFMDVDAIPLGADFRQVISNEVRKCDLLLAIIGPGWMAARDEYGNRRLDNPDDFVRIEIATALMRGLPVIPILLDGTQVPRAADLPLDLHGLALRQGLDVRHASFHSDMDKLIRGLHSTLPSLDPELSRVSVSNTRVYADGRIKVNAPVICGDSDGWFRPGRGDIEWFSDFDRGPEMVVIPAGNFVMGSPSDAPPPPREVTDLLTLGFGFGYPKNFDVRSIEHPQHKVAIAYPLAVCRYPVTWDDLDYARSNGFMAHMLDGDDRDGDDQFGRGRRPLYNVDWNGAKAYVEWLSRHTGKAYRLLSEAEWEYACRAGTKTWYATGLTIDRTMAQFSDRAHGSAGGPVVVGRFKPNAFGLYDMHGNVFEWVEDCWHDSYVGAPTDGSPWYEANCDDHVMRGGSWAGNQWYLRSANRWSSGFRDYNAGFRVARAI